MQSFFYSLCIELSGTKCFKLSGPMSNLYIHICIGIMGYWSLIERHNLKNWEYNWTFEHLISFHQKMQQSYEFPCYVTQNKFKVQKISVSWVGQSTYEYPSSKNDHNYGFLFLRSKTCRYIGNLVCAEGDSGMWIYCE